MCQFHSHHEKRLYNFDPIKPHFYIVKLGFTGVCIIFLILLKKINCRLSLVLTSTHNLCFEQKYEKYENFLSENFPFLVVKFSTFLNRGVFVMIVFSSVQAPLFHSSLFCFYFRT